MCDPIGFIEDALDFVGDVVTETVDFVGDVITSVVDVVVDVVEEVVSWVVPPPEIPDFSEEFEEQQARGILLNKFLANSSIPVVYGTRKVGGHVVFVETSGTDNQYLYMAVVLSEGEINSVETLFVNNHQVTLSGSLTDGTQRTVTDADANFFDTENTNSLITVEAHFGTDSQTSSSLLRQLSSWTSRHRLRGLAYLALRFEWNAEKFGRLPTVQAIVKGRKIYNPNLDGTVTGGSGSHRADTSTTWEYSDNPVLQLLDYLRNDRFGMGITNSYFDSNFADWQTATDVCDANITPVSGASAIDLLDSHIVVDTSKKAINNVKEFVKGSRSYLNFSGGKYNILVESTGTASITLTEDNIIGGISIQSKNKNSRYNRVIVTFVNPDKNYQTDTVQFPPVDETGLASADTFDTMKTEDGDLLLEGRFDYTMLTNAHQAQEMAEIILRRSRSSLDISLRADGTALDLAVGDIVNVTHATPGFSAKAFRVQRISINADHTVSIQCSEHQDSFYTFGTQQALPTIPDTILPNPFNVQEPTISVTDELRVQNEEAISVLLVNVTATDLFITDFEVQAKKTGGGFINLGRGSSSQFELVNVKDNVEYTVRARSVTSVSRSRFVSTTHQVVGKTAPPEDVTNFSVNIIGTEAHLSWTPVGDLDLSHYRIRHAKETSGATYANSIDIADKVSRPANTVIVPAMTGTYFIKAVDKLGNSSENAVSTVAIIESIKGLNLVATSTQSPSFTGTKTNMVVVDGNKLQLGTANLFDSVAGNFDDAGGLFDGGDGNVASSGTYEFDTHIDLGAIYTSRVTANMNVARISFVNLFDDASGNFDDRSGLFDGDPQQFDDTNTELLVATTEGDPSGSPTYTDFRKFFVGDYKARAFKFKLQMTSTKGTATQQVSALSVTVDMPDRVVAEADVVSGTSTSGKAITFSPAFKTLGGVGISAQNLASGDFYAITNKSETGFTIEFFNSSSATVSRTFDYVARGFGEIAS